LSLAQLLAAAYIPAGSCSISGNLESWEKAGIHPNLKVIAVPVLATILHTAPLKKKVSQKCHGPQIILLFEYLTRQNMNVSAPEILYFFRCSIITFPENSLKGGERAKTLFEHLYRFSTVTLTH